MKQDHETLMRHYNAEFADDVGLIRQIVTRPPAPPTRHRCYTFFQIADRLHLSPPRRFTSDRAVTPI